jgi:putative heme-binding domain-containing protein
MRWTKHPKIAVILICCFGLFAGRLAAQKDLYGPHVAPSPPQTPEEERKRFHLPPGFTIELVAAEPFVRKPINIAFDDRGRLWVTESVEYPFPASSAGKAHDTVRILEDTRGTGLADQVITFADGLNIPIGVLPMRDGAVVYSIPNIYRYRFNRGTDRVASREILYGPYGYKDTHGMTGEFTRGFDGWIYACHGFSNTSQIRGDDGSTITMQSGNTYRFKPDGSRVEYFTHGQVNPFGLAFDPLGNLYSCDCHSRPIYQLLRGAWYPSFGKPHDGLGFGPEIMTHDHGSTAIAGITYYAADHFPPEYRDTIFVGNVVTNRINHDNLEHKGSTLKAIQQPDFLSCDDPWFRPVDIKLGPDGALYVADFYNRIIGHYEVPLNHPGRDRERGRIWRIVYKARPKQPRPDWNKATVAELVQDLAHPNLTVRFIATQQLVDRGSYEAVEAARKSLPSPANPFQKMHALWVLECLGALDDDALAAAAKDADFGVRVHAMRILAERKQWNIPLHRLVLDALKESDPNVQRAAADALGMHPESNKDKLWPENIWPLCKLCQSVPPADTHLLHVARMALREQLRAHDEGFFSGKGFISDADSRTIADVATGVPSQKAGDHLLVHLEFVNETPENQLRYVYHIARYARKIAADDRLLEYVLTRRMTPIKHSVALLKAIHQGFQARGAEFPEGFKRWGEDLSEKLLSSSDRNEILAGIELGGMLKLASVQTFLHRTIADPQAPQTTRTTAMTALAGMDAKRAIPSLAKLLQDSSEPLALREKASNLLAGVNRPEAVEELFKALAAAPERLATVIAAGLASTRNGAEKLVDTVAAGKASAYLLQDSVVGIRLSRIDLPGFKNRVAALTKNLPSPDKRFQELFQQKRIGYAAAAKDPTLGAKVFEKHCAICHQIANQGAKIGPQLDGIGIRGFDRLLEDILDPNRNVDQAFRTTTLNLTNGQVVSGLLLREEGKVFVLADNQGKEIRVAKDDVEERTLSQLSPMPANLADQIPEVDFYHLLAYLLAQRPPKETPKPEPNSK